MKRSGDAPRRRRRSKTWILDRAFGDKLWRNNEHRFPAWWRDAMIWHRRNRAEADLVDVVDMP
jgi:hypothetical protein